MIQQLSDERPAWEIWTEKRKDLISGQILDVPEEGMGPLRQGCTLTRG